MIGKDQSPDIGKQTQWKPGERPEGAGKPKGAKHVSSWITEMLEDAQFEQKLKDGTIIKGAPMKAIIKTAIARAMSGDARFLDLLFKYGYGQTIHHIVEEEPVLQLEEPNGVHKDDSTQKDTPTK